MKKSFANLFVGNVVEFKYNDKPRKGEIVDRGGNKLFTAENGSDFGPEWVKVETLEDGPRTFTVAKMKELQPILR